jgi:hypothetical protein
MADVLRVPYEQKANPFAAFIAREKCPASHARDFVSVGVFPVVTDGVDSRLLHLIARFERIGHSVLPLFDHR